MRPIRVALCGASGTGKTVLANRLAKEYGLPVCPVGSRSVAAQMGYASPYDVDAAGARREFQLRLLTEKRRWEQDHAEFVADRAVFDNLAYLLLHDAQGTTVDIVTAHMEAARRYTHVFLLPRRNYQNVAADPQRVANPVYHDAYEMLLTGLMRGQVNEAVQIFYGRAYEDDEERRRSPAYVSALQNERFHKIKKVLDDYRGDPVGTLPA